jgi:hypothetical protein
MKEDFKQLILYRIEKSQNTMKEAKYLAEGEMWGACLNR